MITSIDKLYYNIIEVVSDPTKNELVEIFKFIIENNNGKIINIIDVVNNRMKINFDFMKSLQRQLFDIILDKKMIDKKYVVEIVCNILFKKMI